MINEIAQPKFWLVWNESGHAPVKKHFTRECAENEAKRLAVLNFGQKFHVLAHDGSVEVPITITRVNRLCDAPF